jgi:hypothetical protein
LEDELLDELLQAAVSTAKAATIMAAPIPRHLILGPPFFHKNSATSNVYSPRSSIKSRGGQNFLCPPPIRAWFPGGLSYRGVTIDQLPPENRRRFLYTGGRRWPRAKGEHS